MWQCVNGKDIIRNTWWMSCSHFSAGTQLLDVSVEWSIIINFVITTKSGSFCRLLYYYTRVLTQQLSLRNIQK